MLLTAINAFKIAADKTDVAPATRLTHTGHRAKSMVIVDLQFKKGLIFAQSIIKCCCIKAFYVIT